MGLRISTNVQSIRANRELDSTTKTHTRTLEKLATGSRIVYSGDDAAGLSISEKLRGSIRSYQMAHRNTQDGISMIQTAEGGMIEAQNMLVRLRELSVQAASDTIGDEERKYTNTEFQHLKDEIKRIANTTIYDRTPLLNGSGPSLDFQIGIDHDDASRLTFSSQIANVLPSALGFASADISTKESAREGLAVLDAAISKLSENRAYIGGIQTELGHHMQEIDVHNTNLSAGNSRLRDADFAEWTSKEVSEHIRQDAGNAVLVQANAVPKAALKLLDKA
jgi:flagellin